MKFYTIFDRPKKFEPTNPGERYAPIYEREEGDTAHGEPWYLVKVDEYDVQKEIDSARPPMMSDILNHALRGDTSVLSASQGFYATGDEARTLVDLFHIGQQNLLDKLSQILATPESEVKENVDPSPAE